MKLNIFFFFISLLVLVLTVSQLTALQVYEGSLKVVKMNVYVNFSSSTAFVESSYTLGNIGNEIQTAKISFDYYPLETAISVDGSAFDGILTLAPRQSKTVLLRYSANLENNEKKFFLNPQMRIDGFILAEKIDDVEMILRFDNKDSELSVNSVSFSDEGIQEGKHIYRYRASSIYSSMLNVLWMENAPQLDVKREHTVITKSGEALTLKVSIKNLGLQSVKDIIIYDSFFERNYIPLEPSSEFTFMNQSTEAHYLWKKSIASLEPGQEITADYKVKITNAENIRLNPLRVFVQDKIIKVIGQEELLQIATPPASTAVIDDKDAVTSPALEINTSQPAEKSSQSQKSDSVIDAASPSLSEKEKNDIEPSLKKKDNSKTILVIIIILGVCIVFVIIFIVRNILRKREENEASPEEIRT